MTARIIPQTFTAGVKVTIKPRYKGPWIRGIQRNKRYTLISDVEEGMITFIDDHGFTRYRQADHFVQVCP